MTSITFYEDGVARLCVKGSLDKVSDCQDFSRAAMNELSFGIDKLVVDMSEVSYVPFSFSGFLIAVYKKAKAMNISFSLVVPHEHPAYQLLLLLMIHKVIAIYPNMDVYWKRNTATAMA